MDKKLITYSKYLSQILRHDPEQIGLTWNGEGWVKIDDLLEQSQQPISREMLDEIVATNPKRRFSISQDGTKIRATQGHSRPVDLGLTPVQPPPTLFHGTAKSVCTRILAEGLKPMGRQHVHLSISPTEARVVGARHGSPAVLKVDCAGLVAIGHHFFQAENDVWLSGPIAPEYLSL